MPLRWLKLLEVLLGSGKDRATLTETMEAAAHLQIVEEAELLELLRLFHDLQVRRRLYCLRECGAVLARPQQGLQQLEPAQRHLHPKPAVLARGCGPLKRGNLR